MEQKIKILFQGDSITDAGRAREHDNTYGLGYPQFVAGLMGAKEPTKYQFFNRGVSGNRVVDLYARIKCDFINLQPDVISIMIGVNDVWHEVAIQNGVDAPKFEKVYDMLLGELREALPDVKFILLTPYVLKGKATEEHWDFFRNEVDLRAEATERLAKKYGAALIRTQPLFDKAMEQMPGEYWAADGVHPTPYGHAMLAEEWIRVYHEQVEKA